MIQTHQRPLVVFTTDDVCKFVCDLEPRIPIRKKNLWLQNFEYSVIQEYF